MPECRGSAWWRFGPSLAGLAVLLCFAALFVWNRPFYHLLIQALTGISPHQPLRDIEPVLLAGECWRQGVDVYMRNACMGGGVYSYSPVLLRLGYFPLPTHEIWIAGLVTDLALLASLAVLPCPKSAFEFWVRVAGTISTATVFAMETANIDGSIFVLTILGIAVLSLRTPLRFAGYGIFLVAAAAKFYPVLLMVLAIRERRAVFLGMAAAGGVLGAAILVAYLPQIETAFAVLPSGLPFTWLFGALNLPFGIALLRFLPRLTLLPDAAQFSAALAQPQAVAWVILGLKGLALAAMIAAMMLARRWSGALSIPGGYGGAIFIAGAVIVTGCFFIAQNVDYRGIFLLLVLPGLCGMAVPSAGAGMDVTLRALIFMILFLMWESCLRLATGDIASALFRPGIAIYFEIGFWLLRELLWWCVVTQLLALIFLFVAENLMRLLRSGMPAVPQS